MLPDTSSRYYYLESFAVKQKVTSYYRRSPLIANFAPFRNPWNHVANLAVFASSGALPVACTGSMWSNIGAMGSRQAATAQGQSAPGGGSLWLD